MMFRRDRGGIPFGLSKFYSFQKPAPQLFMWDRRCISRTMQDFSGDVTVVPNGKLRYPRIMVTEARSEISKEERFLASLTEDGRYRLLVDAITDYAIYMLHVDGQVSSWNPGARHLKGYEAAEIIGHHFSRFYTPEDKLAGLPAKALATARAQGRFIGEGWRVRKDGTRFWAAVVIDPVRTPEGELVGFAKITRDLTEKRQSEVALARAREELFQSQKLEAVGKLTGGIAHDFNNLLMAILSSLQLAEKRLPDDPKLKMFIGNAQEAAKRGATLIQRMLAFARRQELKLETAQLHDLVNGLNGIFERTLGPTITLKCDVSCNLPMIYADVNQLETGLLNLVVNARDAMPSGGNIRITARVEKVEEDTAKPLPDKAGEYVVLAVTDSGHGMDEPTLLRAMEPFFTTKGVGKGTGLGLSMVHGMAEQLGGRFMLSSKIGGGTTAEIWLPVAEQGDTPMSVDLPGETSPHTAHKTKRILVVDDDHLVLVNTTAMLEELGHTVVEASTAKEALSRLHTMNGFDLVITDHAMPGITGAELAAILKTQYPGIPVLLVTGYAELPEDVDPDLPRLSKPFSLEQLAESVQRQVLTNLQTAETS